MNSVLFFSLFFFSFFPTRSIINNVVKFIHFQSFIDPKSEEEKYKGSPDMYRSFALPDGQEISIGVERFVTPEVMFDPELIGIRNQANVVDMVFDSLSK